MNNRSRLGFALAPALLLGLTYGLGQIVRDCSLTCNVGFRLSPIVFLLISLLSFGVVSLLIRIVSRFVACCWWIGCAGGGALLILVFRGLTFLLLSGDPSTGKEALQAVYIGFYVVLELLFALLWNNLFGFVRRLFPDEVKGGRMFGYVSACVLVGSLAGAWLGGELAPILMRSFPDRFEQIRDHLMFAMAASLLLSIPILAAGARASGAKTAGPGTKIEESFGLGTAWSWVKSDSRMKRMAWIYLLTGSSAIFMDYIFYWVISQQAEGGSVGLVGFFSNFYIYLSGMTLLLLLFGAGRLSRRFGDTAGLLILPAVLLLGTGGLLAFVNLRLLSGIRIMEKSLKKSIYEPSTESLFQQLDPERYSVLRPVLDGFSKRIGEAAISIALLGFLLFPDLPIRAALGLLLFIQAAWLIAVLSHRRSAR